MTKTHKRKHSGEHREDSTKEERDVLAQDVLESEESEVCVPESLSSTEMKSTNCHVSRMEKHKEKSLDDICDKPKRKTHKKSKNGVNESQPNIDSLEISELPCVETDWPDLLSSTLACSPDKSGKMTKTLKRKNSDVTPDKQKSKKQKTVEKEIDESQELDVSGYHERVTETSHFDLDEILGSSAQELICEADSKKSVDYKTATKSYPMLSKGADGESSRRLAEFKGRNCVSYGTWKKVCKELEKEGE